MKQQQPWEHKKLAGATNGPGNDMKANSGKNILRKQVLMNESEY